MEHIEKQSPFEVIKRIQLTNGNIWISKVLLNNKTFFGIGETKKEAEYNLVQKKEYAINAMPPFLYRIGSYNAFNSPQIVKSISCTNFISALIPSSFKTEYVMDVVCTEKAVCLIVNSPEFELAPQYFWTSNVSFEGIKNCIYQFYIRLQYDEPFYARIQNKKLGKWYQVWYNKLQSKGLK